MTPAAAPSASAGDSNSFSMTPAQPLAAWLDALALEKSPRVLLGCTGHLELSPDDERRAAQQLEQAVLPLLTTADPAALPELRWRSEDHRGDPGATGDREDPHAPGVAGACAASGASP